jgi:hypothetical protein
MFVVFFIGFIVGVGGFVFNFNQPKISKAPTSTLTPTEFREVIFSPTPTGTAAPSTRLPTPTEIPTETPSSTETLEKSNIAIIGNTDGLGVNVRAEPGLLGQIIAKLQDGTSVTLMLEIRLENGFRWQQVLLENGSVGWIASQFLITD